MATNAYKKLGGSVAIAAGQPKKGKASPGEMGQYGDPWGYLPDANGVSQPVYRVGDQVVDTNGLPLTNGGNAATPVSPQGGAGHVQYTDDFLLHNEFKNDPAAVQDKVLAAKRAGKDPDQELTPDEKKLLHYGTNEIFPGITYVDGDENQYANVEKGKVPPSTAAYPGAAGSGAPGAPGPSGVGGTGGAGSSGNPFNQLVNDAVGNQNENTDYIYQMLNPAASRASEMRGADVANRFNNVGIDAGLTGGYMGQNAALLDEQRANAAKYNASDLAALGQYGGALDNANAFNAGNYGQLASQYGTYSQLAPSASSQWQGDLTSQAASAQADPQAIAAQY